jgi:hypothetical protein
MPSVLNVTSIPAPRVPVIDERTGLMSREWYRFFINIFTLTGSGASTETLQDLQVGPPPPADPTPALAVEPALSPGEPPGWALLPRAVVVGASPFLAQNTTGRDVDIIVTGGTVSAIAFSRDNATFYAVGLTAGMFRLSPFDYLRVTYSVAPTMTLVPR